MLGSPFLVLNERLNMKAIVVTEYGDEGVLKYRDVSDLSPNEDQILIRIKAAGVNPVDTYIRQGTHPSAPALPFTPGKDAAGIVEAIGDNVNKVEIGDRVYLAGSTTGSYAELALCNKAQVWKLPENASFEQGAGVFVPCATAYRALIQKAEGKSGETVLIHGASGAVGIAAIQWAKNAGLKVIGTASSPEGRELAEKQGADLVFDHSSETYLEEILHDTEGKGVDIILEMLANVNLVKDFDVLAKFGRIVVIGSRGSLDFDPRLTMGKDATIKGMSLFNASQDDFEDIHSAIYEGLSEGFLDPFIGKKFPLSQAADAHREIIENKAFGKIVLLPDDSL